MAVCFEMFRESDFCFSFVEKYPYITAWYRIFLGKLIQLYLSSTNSLLSRNPDFYYVPSGMLMSCSLVHIYMAY